MSDVMSHSAAARTCWCGNAALDPFSSDYAYCARCGTLVSRADVPDATLAVKDDQADFYGRQYWLNHQREDLKTPDIFDRAHRDLQERCLYWLRALLRYRTPPGSVLELGAAHGAFVALLRWAGFDATGLEVSPWVVEFARTIFDVPMKLGPIEDQDIPAGSLDVIVLNDVLEHLPHPAETMAHCARLLKPDGLFVIQTPQYPERRTREELLATQNRFVEMMDGMSIEHRYLFSERSARQLFGMLGFTHLELLPPLFPYDMFFVAGRQPLVAVDDEEIRVRLEQMPSGRLVIALLDLEAARRQATEALAEANADRTVRLGHVQQMHALLEEANADRGLRLKNVEELGRLLQEANADRAARLNDVEELGRLLEEANADRAARLKSIEELGRLLEQANAERVVHLEQIETLTTLAREAQRALAERTVLLDDRSGEIAAREAEVETLRATIADEDAELARLNARWTAALEAIRAIRRSPIYRALVRAGRWSALDMRFRDAVPDDAPHEAREAAADAEPSVPRGNGARLVGIDLTPILPGGDNGGAKQLVLALLDGFATRARHRYLLLTSERNHEEFARYERPHMRRLCITSGAPTRSPLGFRLRRLVSRGLALTGAKGRLGSEGVELLFCPMTDPVNAEPGIPTVSIVYDLQHVAYPSFFTAAEREHRRRFFERVKQSADAIVCISGFSRSVLIEHAGIEPERVTAIPIAVHHRLPDLSPAEVEAVRRQYGIGDHPFALYPANFWPHKNHRLLLLALARFFHESPATSLRIVLVGSLLDREQEMRDLIRRLGLQERVYVLGYVPEADLAALWKGAFCLLFPSLYEGFGIPVLEAMHYGKPVLCSGVASLPEVGGDAVRYIDPRKPATIVDALRDLLERPGYADMLIAAGQRRVGQFETDHMIESYLDTFDRVLARGGSTQAPRVDGVFGDRWLAPIVLVTTGAASQPRVWDFELNMPEWHPHRAATVRVDLNGRTIRRVRVRRGGSQSVKVPVPRAPAQMRLHVRPSFVPEANGDQRELTLLLTRGCLRDQDSGTVIYEV
jgi:glycosyltransferase involved in cell wall biosynthesis/2-polyprenyl-3-methyl-5-hydroxy-6-metoxy-1,4-benzoquinol methylase